MGEGESVSCPHWLLCLVWLSLEVTAHLPLPWLGCVLALISREGAGRLVTDWEVVLTAVTA